MNKNKKTIRACYEEIKRREISELEDAVRNDCGGGVVFRQDTAPIVMCNFGGWTPHPADVRITRVELCDEEDEEVLRIYGCEKCSSGCSDWYEEEKEINFSDIAYGHIEFITSEITTPSSPQSIADKLTNMVMHEIYGEEFDSNDDITEYDDMSDNWDKINDVLYGILTNL